MLSSWHSFLFWQLCHLDLRDLNKRNFKFTFEKFKHLNSLISIFLNSLASVIAEFSSRNLQKINWTACWYSFYSLVYLARFSNCIQKFEQERKSIHQSMEFRKWTEVAIEEGVLQKQIFRSSYRRCSIKNVFLQILQNSQETPVPD